MKYLLIFCTVGFSNLAFPHLAWSASAKDFGANSPSPKIDAEGFLLITLSRMSYQKPGFNASDPPVPDKTTNAEAHFALKIDDSLRSQFAVHSPAQPGGIKLGIVAVSEGPSLEDKSKTNHVWWIAVGEDGFLYIHGWGQGHEMVLGRLVLAGRPAIPTNMRFTTWENIFFGTSFNYANDLSGTNVGFDFRFVDAKDPVLQTAKFITADPRRAAKDDPTKQTISECGQDLGTFAVQAFFQ